MIKLYTWKTPNGRKPAILLEELDVPYEVYPVDLGQGEQFKPEFLKLSPNNKIPAIVDDEVRVNGSGLSIFESGAILTYLADKYNQFLPKAGVDRYKVLEWTFWQAACIGPYLGEFSYFSVRAKEKVPHALERYSNEADRLLGIMEKRLYDSPYIASKDFSIADMMIYPWIQGSRDYIKEPFEMKLRDKPSVRRWLDLVGNRPAVMRGMKVLEH